MVVGICTIELKIEATSSLKEKRRVLKSIVDRARNRFNISIAEVDNQDLWQRATLGLSTVSNNSTVVHQSLHAAVRLVESHSEVEILDVNMELI